LAVTFMKRYDELIFFSLFIGLSTYSFSLNSNPATELGINEKNQNNCTRGRAEPIIKKDIFPNTTFVLQPDSLTATETVIFKNGDNLIIHNCGCEYYVLTFRFETTKFAQDATNLLYWYQAAGILMTGMLASLNAPIDIKRGLVFLESYYLRDKKNNYINLKLGEEIDFDGSDIRTFVTLDKIEKLSDKKFGVTISFAMGPL
jgi:hypothetical protein